MRALKGSASVSAELKERIFAIYLATPEGRDKIFCSFLTPLRFRLETLTNKLRSTTKEDWSEYADYDFEDEDSAILYARAISLMSDEERLGGGFKHFRSLLGDLTDEARKRARTV